MLAITPNRHELAARGFEPRLFPYEWKRSNSFNLHLVYNHGNWSRTNTYSRTSIAHP